MLMELHFQQGLHWNAELCKSASFAGVTYSNSPTKQDRSSDREKNHGHDLPPGCSGLTPGTRRPGNNVDPKVTEEDITGGCIMQA